MSGCGGGGAVDDGMVDGIELDIDCWLDCVSGC